MPVRDLLHGRGLAARKQGDAQGHRLLSYASAPDLCLRVHNDPRTDRHLDMQRRGKDDILYERDTPEANRSVVEPSGTWHPVQLEQSS